MKSHKLGDHLEKARAHADQWDKTTAEHSDSMPHAPVHTLPFSRTLFLCAQADAAFMAFRET